MRRKILDTRRYLMEIKLGIFFLIAIVLFFFAILSIKEVSLFKGTYIITVKFKFVEGLKPASPVRLAGVDIGEVKRLRIEEERDGANVYVEAKVEKGIKIPVGSRFFINNLTLFGEKYLEIMPPTQRQGKYLEEGAVVEGVDAPPLFEVVKATYQAVSKLKETIQDSNLKANLEQAVNNIKNVTTSIKRLSDEARGLILDIKQKKGTIGRLFYDDSIYRKTDALLQDLKEHPWKLFYKPKKR